MEYTIASTDENHYNRIRVNLPLPSWKYSNVMITSCVCNCNILVMKKGDYIDFTIKDHEVSEGQSPIGVAYKLTITANITDIKSAQTLIATLPSISNLNNVPISFTVNTDERITIYSQYEFTINDMSYNMKLILGMYNKIEFPISSTLNNSTYIYNIKSVGYFLSTPILYLLSNLGGVNYFNLSDEKHKIDASCISMRLLNSFTASMPIIGSNSEFSKITLSTDLTDFELILVDANLHEIDLLNPIYITINISNASDSMTLEDADKYEYVRKVNKEEEMIRLQMLKVKFDRINKEVKEDFELKFE